MKTDHLLVDLHLITITPPPSALSMDNFRNTVETVCTSARSEASLSALNDFDEEYSHIFEQSEFLGTQHVEASLMALINSSPATLPPDLQDIHQSLQVSPWSLVGFTDTLLIT